MGLKLNDVNTYVVALHHVVSPCCRLCFTAIAVTVCHEKNNNIIFYTLIIHLALLYSLVINGA